MAIEAIYEHPEDYDLEVAARGVQDLPFWHDLLLREQPARVLEIGSGTGRLTIPLARLGQAHGYSLTGLEPEPAMLAYAQARSREEGVDLRFIGGDIRSLDLPDRYDMILLPYGAAHHLLSLDDQLAAWGNVRRHLTPRGLFCIDLVAPDFRFLSRTLTGLPPRRDLDAQGSDGRVLRRTVASHYDRADQLATHAYRYQVREPGGSSRRYRSTFAMHVYFPREVVLLCRCTGFQVERMLGSYAGEPFAAHSELLITLARAI